MPQIEYCLRIKSITFRKSWASNLQISIFTELTSLKKMQDFISSDDPRRKFQYFANRILPPFLLQKNIPVSSLPLIFAKLFCPSFSSFPSTVHESFDFLKTNHERRRLCCVWRGIVDQIHLQPLRPLVFNTPYPWQVSRLSLSLSPLVFDLSWPLVRFLSVTRLPPILPLLVKPVENFPRSEARGSGLLNFSWISLCEKKS